MKKNKIKNRIIMGLILLGCASAHSQQDPQYTHYMYNTQAINPAYAGSRGSMNFFGLHRQQWVGLDGAPQTTAFSVHTPFTDSKMGIGVGVVNDKLGIINENRISLDLSYTIDLDAKGDNKLSFGIKGTANMLDVSYSRLNASHSNDPYFQTDVQNEFSPNIGAGVYWYTDKSYIGLSVPNFLENARFKEGGVYSSMNQRMNFYLMGGHVFRLSPNLQFKPAFLLKAVEGAPLQADLTANFWLYERLTLGAAYRWDAAWSALIGFQITDGLLVGYSYDGDVTKLVNYNKGSHEVFLRFELFNKYRRVNSPRFF